MAYYCVLKILSLIFLVSFAVVPLKNGEMSQKINMFHKEYFV